ASAFGPPRWLAVLARTVPEADCGFALFCRGGCFVAARAVVTKRTRHSRTTSGGFRTGKGATELLDAVKNTCPFTLGFYASATLAPEVLGLSALAIFRSFSAALAFATMACTSRAVSPQPFSKSASLPSLVLKLPTSMALARACSESRVDLRP